MSAALEKSSEEFNKLKSCVVDISAKRVDCDIKDVPDRKMGIATITPSTDMPLNVSILMITLQISLTTIPMTAVESPKPNKRLYDNISLKKFTPP